MLANALAFPPRLVTPVFVLLDAVPGGLVHGSIEPAALARLTGVEEDDGLVVTPGRGSVHRLVVLGEGEDPHAVRLQEVHHLELRGGHHRQVGARCFPERDLVAPLNPVPVTITSVPPPNGPLTGARWS